MKKHFIFLFLLFPTLLLSQGGNSGLKFLYFFNSKLSSLGESYAVSSENASSTIGNPAGLIKNENTNLELGVRQYIQDISSQFVLVKTNLSEKLAMGFHLLNTRIPDIEIRTQPGDAQGTFTSEDLSTGLSFAYRISDDFRAGLTAKYLFEKIFINESSGFGIDFGVNYSFSKELNFGFSINNLGKMSLMNEVSTTLPTTAALGSSYNLQIPDISSNALVIFEIHDNVVDKEIHFSFGGEFNYNNLINFRIGYITGFESKGLTTGLGIKYNFLNLDYAYIPFSLNLGSSHTITLGFEF